MIEHIKSVIAGHDPASVTRQRKYAVLLPLVRVDDELHILFEIRSNIVSQPGETSFPGGALEERETYREAALRETEEELVLDRNEISILGEMDYIVKEDHVIKCFVGWLPDTDVSKLAPNEEVADVFTIPLQYFLTNEPLYHNVQYEIERTGDDPVKLDSDKQKYKWKTIDQQIPFYSLSDYYLWGYTAHLTHRFSELIKNKTNQINFEDDRNDK
ncbi:NUDIX hydrolase [Alkalibacterium kapii]|uniref:Coenzyme A pyrophosphatase n=1 Tax=Alkalibacterium kapii TaxID=426704 RepID=A0A511B261_9LACT|nr:CoA pyrophosphatase [Alkalibacterium kapii]GEK91907.1 coenzyme A pyrophosphatase [Alkalibacterium kapii]